MQVAYGVNSYIREDRNILLAIDAASGNAGYYPCTVLIRKGKKYYFDKSADPNVLIVYQAFIPFNID